MIIESPPIVVSSFGMREAKGSQPAQGGGNRRLLTCIGLIVAGFASLVGAVGCMTNRINPVDAGVVTVERLQPQRLYLPAVDVYVEDGTALVAGSIRRRSQ